MDIIPTVSTTFFRDSAMPFLGKSPQMEDRFMDQETQKIPLAKQLFSIPNLLGYFRIILIPIIMWKYFTAQEASDYYIVTLLVVISGLSDALDGQIARRFHMVTPLGKALDPVADKLTQGALAVCLMTRYPLMTVLFVLFLVKEGFMAVTGILYMKRGEVYGALWFGKVCTVVLYAVMIILLFFPGIPAAAANILIAVSLCFMVYSLIRYAIIHIRHLSGKFSRNNENRL